MEYADCVSVSASRGCTPKLVAGVAPATTTNLSDIGLDFEIVEF